MPFYIVSIIDDRTGGRKIVYSGEDLETASDFFHQYERRNIDAPSSGVMFQKTFK